jgi:hypothetical protein
LQKTFATNCFLIALEKLHAILLASVNEVNGQQNASPFVYYCMSFVYYHKNQQFTKSHEANEKGLKKLCFKNRRWIFIVYF